MLALASTHLSTDTKSALERARSWELRQVPNIREALATMSPDERELVRAIFVESEPIGEPILSTTSK
jgi:hypothetical protein